MRGWLLISMVALAGCAEHRGWNPNYQFHDTPYGKYRIERESALVTGKEPPSTVPVALPVDAPEAKDIAGESPVSPPPTMGLGEKGTVAADNTAS